MNSDFPIVATLMQLQTALVGLPQPLIDQMHAAGPFKVLIATILSLRTRDDTTAVAAPRLFAVADTPQTMVNLSADEVAQLIYPVGFYRTKARDILAICQQLLTNHAGEVPADMNQLLASLQFVSTSTSIAFATAGAMSLPPPPKKPSRCSGMRCQAPFGYQSMACS